MAFQSDHQVWRAATNSYFIIGKSADYFNNSSINNLVSSSNVVKRLFF